MDIWHNNCRRYRVFIFFDNTIPHQSAWKMAPTEQSCAGEIALHKTNSTQGWYSTVHYGFPTTLLIDCTNITSVKTSGHVYWWFPSFWASCLLMPLNMLAWFFRAYNLSLCVYCCLHVIPRIYIDLESQVCSVYTRNIDDSLEIRPAWS